MVSRGSARQVVTGAITFEGEAAFEGATVHVRLEDTGVLDASAVVMSEAVLDDVAAPPAGGAIRFELPPGAARPGERYNVRVHVDVDIDGAVSEGDYVTVRSYPVVLGDDVTVVVKQV